MGIARHNIIKTIRSQESCWRRLSDDLSICQSITLKYLQGGGWSVKKKIENTNRKSYLSASVDSVRRVFEIQPRGVPIDRPCLVAVK